MRHNFTPVSGHLTLIMEGSDDREIVQSILENPHLTEHGRLADLLDQFGFMGNGVLLPIVPGFDIGALTDAPMITDFVDHDDDGKVCEVGNVWWYEPYQIKDFLKVLLAKGEVTFYAAPDNKQDPQPTYPVDVSPARLADIVTRLLVSPAAAGELDGAMVHNQFVQAIAEVVADYCGGDIAGVLDGAEGPVVTVTAIDSLPEDGGIWTRKFIQAP